MMSRLEQASFSDNNARPLAKPASVPPSTASAIEAPAARSSDVREVRWLSARLTPWSK
jgi:hypothetical protein